MVEVIDQMGRKVSVPELPQRIVSLVPSQTELLYHLGLADRVVGLTKFCIHPEHWRSEKTIVGGTKKYHLDKIHALKPDLIIGNKEENEQQGIEALARDYPVWMSDIGNLKDALGMIEAVGGLVGKGEEAQDLVNEIQEGFSAIAPSPSKPSVIYLIWKDPYMAAGKDTFIDNMISTIGFENLVKQVRYPALDIQELQRLNPDALLLSSEPYPFKEKHVEELKLALPNTQIELVDGELFSWYGSRLTESPAYFNQLMKKF
ncbi:cobalamin-binding protein [Roseivirga sp. 4D4]|uniref:helical backbone metal receptor n=1 Tax=Roseivirga sp. 4D4 TaxID=1889784 RepID=UPI000852C652|nr:helical backbone metal receptor [Roseivirga sp. 4D4]OEK03582.1 cobalamin-binding protein [Roseivirga sp. 4D4]